MVPNQNPLFISEKGYSDLGAEVRTPELGQSSGD